MIDFPSSDFKPSFLSNIDSWHGHVFFVRDLIEHLRPSLIVELGVHKGDSLFAIGQSCEESNLETKIFGIDHWRGDSHAGKVDDKIFSNVSNISNNNFKNITLIQSSFDDALKSFDNQSVDIIHIDGFHSYEAAKNDFENWFPKLKDDGVLLMHDISSLNDDFGVVDFWNEIKREFITVQFEHSQGLGILFNRGFRKKTNYFKRLLNSKYIGFFKTYYSLHSTILRLKKVSNDFVDPFETQMYESEFFYLENSTKEQLKLINSFPLLIWLLKYVR